MSEYTEYRKVTLGGLGELQRRLESHGHYLSVFKEDIYGGGGFATSLDLAIRSRGAGRRVINVELADSRGNKILKFSQARHVEKSVSPPKSCILLLSSNNPDFTELIRSTKSEIYELARWGKTAPSVLDKLLFRLLPRVYAARAFAEP